jgi:hypothetical protein
VLQLSTDELVQLAPRLRGYLVWPLPTWPGVVEAADWLRGELGVSKPLWGEACIAMGPGGGSDRGGDRLGEARGSFPDLIGRVFPRHGGEGEGWRVEPGADDLGLAWGRPTGRGRAFLALAELGGTGAVATAADIDELD